MISNLLSIWMFRSALCLKGLVFLSASRFGCLHNSLSAGFAAPGLSFPSPHQNTSIPTSGRAAVMCIWSKLPLSVSLSRTPQVYYHNAQNDMSAPFSTGSKCLCSACPLTPQLHHHNTCMDFCTLSQLVQNAPGQGLPHPSSSTTLGLCILAAGRTRKWSRTRLRCSKTSSG